MSIRALARRLGLPSATVGDYCSGRHLPGIGQQDAFLAILSELGVREPADQDAWLAALARIRAASDGRASRPPSPYRGLEPYGEADAAAFFGRGDATAAVLARLDALAGGGGGMLALVGPSGSGKSSLLQAGVLSALAARRAAGDGAGGRHVVLAPGRRPLDALAVALGADAGTGGSAGDDLVVVVDQLEEVLAPDVEAAERTAFLAELDRLAGDGALVVVGLRADFYEVATREPVLLRALRDHQVLLGPMTEAEVRQVIVEPARTVGAVVEDALVDLLLADLAPRNPTGFAYEPGALPLLSHALLATWVRAGRSTLTVADYLDTGGLGAAVRHSAEACFARLEPAERRAAQDVFLRLVNLGEDTPVTRRRVPWSELADDPAADDVVAQFVEARLLTAEADAVQLSHEILLTAWPRLSGWIDEDRDGLRLHRQLGEAARAWAGADRDEAHLLRGSRLETVSEWAASRAGPGSLNRVERELLEASLAHAAAERTVARRRARRMQQLLAALAVLVLVAAGLAVSAFRAESSAAAARDRALSRQVAIEAGQLAPTQPSLAMQLAVAAYRVAPTRQARSALLDATAGPMTTRLLGPAGPAYAAVDRGPRPLLAVASALTASVQLYRLGRGLPRPVARIRTSGTNQVFCVALSPDGRLLALGGASAAVRLYDLARPGTPREVGVLRGFASSVYAVAFSPAGTELAAASADGTVREWHLSGPAAPGAPGAAGPPAAGPPVAGARAGALRARLLAVVRAPGAAALHAVAFSPTGTELAAGGAGGTLLVWPDRSSTATTVPGVGAAGVETVAFSPNGRLLATGGDDDAVRVFAVGTGRPRLVPRLVRGPLTAGTGFVYALAFSPSGSTLVSGAADGTVDLWPTSTWQPVGLAQPDAVTSLAFAAGSLVATDAEGITRLTAYPPPVTYRTPGRVFFFAVPHRGRLVGAVTTGATGGLDLWRATPAGRLVHLREITLPAPFGPDQGAAALSGNGRLLALDNARAEIQLVDVAHLRHPRAVGPPLVGARPLVEDVAFNPAATLLAAGDDAGEVRLWDVTDPAHPRPLPRLTGPRSQVLSVAFSPDGRLLAAASADDHVWLWSLAHPGRPRHLATLGGFSSYAYSVAFSPDGRLLAAGSADSTVRLWDVADPAHPRPVGGPLTGPTSYVLQVAFSPDGRTLAASTDDGSVWLYGLADPARPVPLATLRAATGQDFAVGFLPGGHHLIAGGSEEDLHVWTVPAAAAERQVCAVAGTPITRGEWRQYVEGAPYRPPCRAGAPG